MARDYRLSICVDAQTKEEAVRFFEQKVAHLKSSGWSETWGGAGGGAGCGFTVHVGPRPLSHDERIERLEAALQKSNVSS